MSNFTTHGAVYPIADPQTNEWFWALLEPLIWEVRGPAGTFIMEVPEGFRSDLGSIPFWARLVINPADPQLAKAFILHDWILEAFGPQCQPFAASQLYEALRSLKVPRWRRQLITIAVIAAIDDW